MLRLRPLGKLSLGDPRRASLYTSLESDSRSECKPRDSRTVPSLWVLVKSWVIIRRILPYHRAFSRLAKRPESESPLQWTLCQGPAEQPSHITTQKTGQMKRGFSCVAVDTGCRRG